MPRFDQPATKTKFNPNHLAAAALTTVALLSNLGGVATALTDLIHNLNPFN